MAHHLNKMNEINKNKFLVFLVNVLINQCFIIYHQIQTIFVSVHYQN
jgi:hypothetical protein